MEGAGEIEYGEEGSEGRYEGGWRAGRREGKGAYTFPEGEQQLCGRWVADGIGEGGGGGGGGGGGSPSALPLAGEILLPRPFAFPSLAADEGSVHLIPISMGNSLSTAHYQSGFEAHGGITEDKS